jgi:hypothetical protein
MACALHYRGRDHHRQQTKNTPQPACALMPSQSGPDRAQPDPQHCSTWTSGTSSPTPQIVTRHTLHQEEYKTQHTCSNTLTHLQRQHEPWGA